MLRRLYHWTLAKAADRRAEWWLAAVAFMESSFFPIPPDVLLIPMALARPERALRFAGIATLASTVGAAFGWIIGASFFATAGQWLLGVYGVEEQFTEIAARFNEEGALIVFLAGFTPIPFKVITIASGATGLSIYVLLTASLVSRGARFFLVGGLLKLFGEPAKALIERHFGLVTTLAAVLLVGGFVAVRFLI